MTLLATEADAGLRLDQFLARHVPDLSRSQAQRLIRDGHVRLARGAAKPALVVAAGFSAVVDRPAPTAAEPSPEALPFDVLYDDDDMAVVNKPAHMVVHPAAGHASGTLVNALLHRLKGLSGVGGRERPGIVHRLDRGTSGVMVVAKHDRAHRDLARQFHDRLVTKEYIALVWGALKSGASMRGPIGRDPRNRRKMSTRSRRARPATTDVVSVETLRGVSLLRLTIGTGRTHQIRVHLSELGHPVVGDELYGGRRRPPSRRLADLARLTRPFLHASRLTLMHPTRGDAMTFDAPLPPDLQDVLDALRQEE